MSAKKKRRGAKVLPDAPQESQMDSPNLSTIDQTSFMKGLQLESGNPLHSTALEEDLKAAEEEQVDYKTAKSKVVLKTHKTAMKHGPAVKVMEMDKEGETKRSRRVKDKTRPVQRQQQTEDKKREMASGDEEEESDPGTTRRTRRRALSSDEEGEEDPSWNPSPKIPKSLNITRTRRSSSGGSRSRKSSGEGIPHEDRTSGGVETSEGQERERPVRLGGSHFEVVLDAFLGFCEQYSETVVSAAVKKSLSCFSNGVRQQLQEKISTVKELSALKRENTKVSSLVRTKTQRLLDAKHELMRAERQVRLLEKEEGELQQRLADVKQGHALLHDIRELSRRYLDHRHKHPSEEETYGVSSLPGLLMETRFMKL